MDQLPAYYASRNALTKRSCLWFVGKQEGVEGNKALQKDVAHANRCYEALVAHFRDEVSIWVLSH